jgi:TatD DNase family protein
MIPVVTGRNLKRMGEARDKPFPLVDTHAHLQDSVLRDDLAGILARAREAGVTQVVAVGITAADSREVVQIAQENLGVFAAVGVQPNYAAEALPGDWEGIVELVGRPGVVAIGETGLDRHWDQTPFTVQQDWFERHLDLAQAHALPVVIHCRNCESDIVEQLGRREGPIRGVLHSFTGTWEDAEAFLALGLFLSFAGMVTFAGKKLDPLREVAARVPLDRILVETDSPYLSPHPFRGRTNEPGRLPNTAARIAEIRGLGLPDFSEAVTANARRLFGLSETETLGTRPQGLRDR